MRPIRWVLAATAALALASSATARQASATEGNARRALLAQDEGDGAEGVDGGEAVETGGGGNEAFDSTISGPGTVPGEPQVLLANGISMARRASATDGNAGRALLAQDEGDGAEGVDGGEAVETGGGGDEAFDSTISGPGTAPAESQVLLADAISMALDTVPAGLESCDRGEGSLKVAFALSNCFTSTEMKAIIQQVNTAIATAASNKFYFNDAFIERKFAWGYYLDGLCSNRPVLTTIGEVKPWPNVGFKYDLFVNVAKNKGGSFLPLLPITTLRVDRTLATRICAGTSCPTPNTAITVPTIATYGSVASSVTNAMYCGGVTGSSPATYTSDQNKKQCGCGCPGDKVPSNGCCECPGELEAIAGGDTCGCTNGRTKTADNKCICTGGRTYTAGECRCQTGYSYDGTVCVRDCFWLAGNAGSVCPWGDPLKTFLTLSTDCQIVAPVPQDNYVGDKRTNKFDPTSPAAYGSPSNDPKITISAAKTGIATDTKSTSWLNYALSPGTLEDNVHLTTFGVFDLSLVASDYRGHAQCVGCVAVQDTFPPTPTNPCGLDTTTTVVHNDYSVAKLGEYVAAEDTFTNFYANVQNNGAENAAGDNKRADVESTTLVDFFNTAVPSATLATRCFTDNYVSELLNSASTMTLDAVSAVARSADKSSLVCERCCTKHKVLKEEWYPYTCATPNPPKQVQGTAECNLNRCLKTQPTTLLSATFGIAGDAAGKTTTTINGLPAGTVGTTGTNYIHRSVTCKTWAEACTVGVTLENLFTKTADWKPTAAVPPTYDAANFVTYIYKVGAGGSWAAWNDATELTFSGEETEVYVQAWSRCGLIQENMFVFKIHLHSSRDVCKDFQQRWVDNSPTPRTAPNDISATCAYPGSDFALLTFNYDSSENVPHEAGKVKGKYTNLVCTLVAEDAAPTVVTTGVDMTPSFGLADPKPTPFTIAKQFAVELLKEPTTSKNTHVSISCVFTFQYFDTSTTTTDTCSASFVFTDCDLPTVDTASESVQCLPRDCGGPNALPGAFETCNGDVFTTAVVGGVSTTQTKPLTDACCAACSSALQCAAVSGTSSVKRCVPTPALVLAALAMDETDRAARTVMEAETEAQPLSSSTMALLMGATAMVAVVALVVAKTRAKKKQQTVADDAYVSLLD